MILGVRGKLCATWMHTQYTHTHTHTCAHTRVHTCARTHTRAHTHTVSDDCKSAVRVVFLQPMSSILVKLLRTLEFQVLGVLEGQTLMGKKRRPRKPKDFEGGVQEVGLRKDCVKERK